MTPPQTAATPSLAIAKAGLGFTIAGHALGWALLFLFFVVDRDARETTAIAAMIGTGVSHVIALFLAIVAAAVRPRGERLGVLVAAALLALVGLGGTVLYFFVAVLISGPSGFR